MNSIENTLNNKIRFRQKIANTKDWADDFILLSGEIGIEICEDKSKKVKIGDGNTPWSDLDYIVVDIDLSNIISEINKIQIEVDEATLAAERLQYYGDSSIVPTDISYFTYEAMEDEYGNLSYYIITGLTDEGKFLEEIIIPYQIDGINVTEIGSEAFIGCLFLKTVILPNSIKNIQGAAFFGCQALTGINIPDSVIFIGSSVFTGCTSLTTINIPNSETFMNGTFDGIENSIAIICNKGSYAETYAKENGINYILDTVDPERYAENLALERLQYYGDSNIIPTDISYFTYKVIEDEDGYSNSCQITGLTDEGKTLENIVIPYEISGLLVTQIGSKAFNRCTSLKNIIIPNSITDIGNNAFRDCTSLLNFYISENITSLGIGVFCRCTSIKELRIPNSITAIPQSAFYGCNCKIKIPDTVNSIDLTAFQYADANGNFQAMNPNISIICNQGSYAELYAKDNGINYILDTVNPEEYAAAALVGSISPQAHSRIFRGKNLGSTVTDEQKAAIKDGSFKDLFLGDYWKINGVNWRIVDMDYWYNTGSTALTTHHLVIMPDTRLYYHVMNDDYTTDGGYVGSKMYTEGLTRAKTTISGIFGDMVLTHKEHLSNAVTDGIVTGSAFKDSTVELPSEIMMYGTNIFSPINDGTCTFSGYTFCKTQLALFDVAPRFIVNRDYYWLRDVVSSDSFAGVGSNGGANWNRAHIDHGVRPYFCIG